MKCRLRIWLLAWLLAGTLLAETPSDKPYCVLLDGPAAPLWALRLGYVTRAAVSTDTPNAGDLGWGDVAAQGGVFYAATDFGEFDFRLAMDGYLMDGGSGMKLPSLPAAARLQAWWTLRAPSNGRALRFNLQPGVYSDWKDLSSDDLFMPFGLEFIQAFNPRVSAWLGLQLYPSFEHVWDPRAGLRWQPAPEFLLDLAYPESRIAFQPAPGWEIFGGARFLRTLQYRLQNHDEREAMTLLDNRVFGGASRTLANGLQISLELGAAFDRQIGFKNHQPDAELEGAWYFNLGLAAPL